MPQTLRIFCFMFCFLCTQIILHPLSSPINTSRERLLDIIYLFQNYMISVSVTIKLKSLQKRDDNHHISMSREHIISHLDMNILPYPVAGFIILSICNCTVNFIITYFEMILIFLYQWLINNIVIHNITLN